MTTTCPDVLSPEYQHDPVPFYRIMHEDFPVFHHEASGYYFISRYEDVVRAFKDSETFSSENYSFQLEPVIGKTFMQLGGRDHSVQRQLVTPTLRGKWLEGLSGLIEANADVLFDKFRSRGQTEFVDEFSRWFPINVIVDMLGLPKEELPRFHELYKCIMANVSNITADPDIAEWGRKTNDSYGAYILPIINQRRDAELTPDLISHLAHAEVDGEQYSDEQIKALVGLMINAGGETTDKALAYMIKNLLEHPEQFAALREDRALALAVLAENLRYSPPVPIDIRTATTDVEMSDGSVIPAQSIVALMIGAANRDASRWKNPNSFDIYRDDMNVENAFLGSADHLTFALGRHFCVGSLLAKREMEIALDKVLDEMPDLRFADGFSPIEVGLFTRGPQELRLEFTTRN